MHPSFVGVRQHLSARGVALARHAEGFEVWSIKDGRKSAEVLPCLDSAHLYGIKLQPARGGHC